MIFLSLGSNLSSPDGSSNRFENIISTIKIISSNNYTLVKKSSYYETILISINDYLVDKYLKGHINYSCLNNNLIKLTKIPYFTRYYNSKPKNIIDIICRNT